ncbi:type II toxin-antitoxin system death-on-curing family toxin [Microbacterium sp.]|jgi:prophage maintenance system killer protein|uniref:type II toxin-antitoxin system death-on-curing family toxin n=1 Tax=Microbacterium sp. TaxID=51671 RepID=UPI0037C851E0
MTDITYLTYEQVVDLNARHVGAGGGVRDEQGIRAALGRAVGGFAGVEAHVGVVAKAAAILHGLASTQYFFDGNKRTAFLAATLFLGTNGHLLRDMDDVELEALVLAVATSTFATDDEPDRSLRIAREWFEAKRLTAGDRVAYAQIAQHLESDPVHPRVTNATRLGLDRVFVGEQRGNLMLHLFVEITPHMLDVGMDHELALELESRLTNAPVRFVFNRERETFLLPASNFTPHMSEPGKTLPIAVKLPLPLHVRGAHSSRVLISFDGEIARSLPLYIDAGSTTVPDSFDVSDLM